ncbi:hypothetical protein [Staphylococcus phage APTC_SA_12]|nr:MAG: hypothetical protein [Staphylococcus phage RP2]UPO38550.1 hypothetical protein [Staphylococcus phage vB_SaS_GE1]UWV20046.1 hypothetical protein [Staphylococcus phage APTC_SA_2]UWV20080.1 hypothetical protein [Staphylococcus phage APTC_SA_4]UWV20494.1 hypothetical protein [Staphylococcus phage APTC_SA_12]UWV20630.1 hypothetical protein [Staphylococcus phage APTC_SA_13]WMT38751.1 hypothetical protein [Staphylococcus phage Sp2021]WPH67165.1 hypothetical protein CUBM_gp5c [Staphylococcus
MLIIPKRRDLISLFFYFRYVDFIFRGCLFVL